jgi:predicted GNAT superfamily acetyltransferase
MILDKQLIFSDAQAVTTAAETASTNIIDMLAAGDAYESMFLLIQVETAVAATAGAANVTFKLQTDDNSSFSSPTTLWASSAIAKGTLVDKYVVAKLRVPMGVERYLRVTYTPDTNDLTAGKFDAMLVYDVQTNR